MASKMLGTVGRHTSHSSRNSQSRWINRIRSVSLYSSLTWPRPDVQRGQGLCRLYVRMCPEESSAIRRLSSTARRPALLGPRPGMANSPRRDTLRASVPAASGSVGIPAQFHRWQSRRPRRAWRRSSDPIVRSSGQIHSSLTGHEGLRRPDPRADDPSGVHRGAGCISDGWKSKRL